MFVSIMEQIRIFDYFLSFMLIVGMWTFSFKILSLLLGKFWSIQKNFEIFVLNASFNQNIYL